MQGSKCVLGGGGACTLWCLQVVARALARKRVTFALAVHGLEALEQLRGGARYK